MSIELSTCKRQDLLQKADVLKHYEVYSYQIAYYLLENEALATEATSQALIDLYQHNRFFQLPHLLQEQVTKEVTIKHSLLKQIEHLPCSEKG